MKKKSLSVIGKIFTSVILTCYSFAPSVMAIDDLISTDNSQDILDVGISDPTWITNGNPPVTSNVVVLGETYVAPQNSDVTVTFTKLPSNPSTLSINEITLTNEEVDATGAVSNKAYDINTSMMDGTFEYDLTLPSSSNNTKVVYAENRSELLDNVQEVSNPVVDQGNTVKVEDLNHFTLFILVSADKTENNNSVGTYNNGWVSDNQYATFDSSNDYAEYSFPDISIPSNATITGIEVFLEGKTGGRNFDVSLWNQSNSIPDSYSSTKTTSLTSSDTTITLGSISDLWGETWTVSDFNTSFKVKVDATSGGSTASLDALQVKVHYSIPITPPVLVDNPLDKYAMTSVTGIWTSISGGSGYSGINTNEIRWGTPAGSTKSGLKFTNSGAQSFNEGNTFYLGMLTHMNWGTQAGTAATGATLQITLDFNRPDIANQVLTYGFAIEETSNGNIYYCPAYQISGTPCDDKVTFPNSYGTQVFVIDDVQYTLVIDGFVSEYPSGSALSAFITEEQKDNSAFLVGHLSSVLVERPAISIIKKTNNQDITAAPGDNLYVGDSVTWQYVVQNTGNTTLNNITVTDNPAETITCPSTSLASGASMTCTASGTVMAGQFTNTATVTSGTLSASDTSYYNGISRSHLIVQKTTLPAGDTTLFDINASASAGAIFGVTTGTISDSTDKDYSVSAGTYSVTETVPAGWGQTSNTCTNVVVGINETKTCTITNRKLPTLTIEKVLLGDSTSFSNFSYKVDGGIAVPFETDGSNTIFVVPGSNYAITEVDPGSSFNVTYSSGCNGNLTYGQSAICTITNTKYASLTIVKDANPNSIQSFEFNTSGIGLTNFSLTDDGSVFGSNTRTFTNLLPATYSVTENAVSGWDSTSSCTDGSLNTAINISAGESVTCTFVNVMRGAIGGHKYNDADGDYATNDRTGVFGWTIELYKNGIKIDETTTDINGAYGFSNLVSGTYQLREALTIGSGWYKIYPTAEYLDITLLPGENDFGNNFINVKYPTITVLKNVDTNADGVIDITGATDWTWDINGNGNHSTGSTVSVNPGTYTISEDQKANFNVTNLTCNGTSYGAVEGQSVILTSGQDLVCTFTNTRSLGTIHVVKILTNDNGGSTLNKDSFGFQVENGTVIPFESDGTNDITVLEGFQYDITEPSYAGYETTYSNCENIHAGDTCVITNNDIAPTLKLIKTLTTDNGGNETAHMWDLTASGSDGGFMDEGDANEFHTVKAGVEYTLSESGPSGYVASNWSCDGGSLLGDKLTLHLDEDVTCTITNDDIAPVLVLDKILVTDNNGNETESYWTLSADGGSAGIISGQGASGHTDVVSDSTFKAGTYTLNENSTGAAYTSGPWSCVKNGGIAVTGSTITLSVGDTAVCTITNNDIAPTLTVIKNVVNDNGGNAVIGDFDIKMNGSALSFDSGTASGNTTTYTATPTALSNTSYMLSEADLAGYTEGTWSCVDYMTGATLSNPLILNEGQDAICTITNNDVAPTITLTKIVNNNHGGNATANDFGLTVGGTSVTSGQTLNVNANEAITLNEAGLFGYSFVSITGDTKCPSVLGGTVTLNEGENLVCTITNNDIAPQLTVVKHVVNNTNDTNSVAANFQMLVSGTNVSNPSFAGSEAGTTLTLNAGSYNVTELYNTSNYTQSIGNNCSGTIGIGESKTCTITNTDIDHFPTIEVNKTANDNDIPETGQNVTFTYTVKNTSSESVNITYLNDSVFGTLDGNDTCKVGTTLAQNASCSFTLTKFISGDAGSADHENVFVVEAQDDETNTTGNHDNEVISFYNVNPDITVTKTASVESVPETGADVLFTFTIQNNTAESVMIMDLVDDKFGDLTGDLDCNVGTVLAGNSSCSFEHTFSVPAGVAPAIHTNVFTATVMDDEENTDSASATANVSLTYVPTLKLVKSVENAYNSDGFSSNWILSATGDRYGFSAVGDEGAFHVVTPRQTYTLSEEGPDGFTASQWSCDKEGVLNGNVVTLAPEDDVTCTITNTAQPGTITVYKDVVNADYIGEGVYSDTEFNVTLNNDLTNIQTISDTNDASNNKVATFSNLDAGPYSINELEKDGFLSLGCHVINERPSLMGTGTFYVGNGENIEVVCTNRIIVPELQIAKANNAGGVSLVAGSNVLYTLIVTAPESQDDGGNYIIENVKVVDLPPAGIKYQVGSWTAISNIRGNLKAQSITTEPTYASPGKWNLGKMLEGEVITLTYVGNISDTLDAGKYKDLAWTEGVTLTDNRTLGSAATGFFASTDVNITEPVEQGQVLGITDEQTLPDTGASTILTIGAICTMLLGLAFIIFSPKKKMMKVLGLLVVALVGITSLVMPTRAYADSGDLAVEIEQPKTPYSESSFEVGFVALDIQSRSITVQCYETTHGAFGPEYTLNTIGNSGNCVVDSSVVTSDGTYEFYVVAKAGADEVTSDKVSVIIDLVEPSPVLNYTKTTASCTNNLEFTTANDGQTAKVQIFRSDKATFTADSSTLIKEIVAGPNQLVTYSDTQPVCGQTYFYAVRALDVADNTSTFVTDKTVVVTIVPATPTTPVTPTVVPVEEVKGTETTEDNTDTNTNEEVKGVTDEETQSNVWSWLKYVLIGVGAITIISISYVYARKRNRGNEIK